MTPRDETIAELRVMSRPKVARLSVTVPADLALFVHDVARQAGIPTSHVVEYALRKHLVAAQEKGT